jgi:hypothetical protein
MGMPDLGESSDAVALPVPVDLDASACEVATLRCALKMEGIAEQWGRIRPALGCIGTSGDLEMS